MTNTTTTQEASTMTSGKKPRVRRNEIQDLPSAQKTLGLDAQSVRPHYEIIKELAPFHVPVDKLRENPSNRGGVYDDVEIEAVARTLRVRQEDPIQVFPVDSDGTRLIHDGHLRFRAAKKAGLPSLLAIEIPPLNGADAAASRFVHNVRRSQLTPWQEALEFQAMKSEGFSDKQAATRAGVTEDVVTSRLKLLALPADVGAKIGSKGFTAAHAEVLLPIADKPELIKEASKLVGKREYGAVLNADQFARNVVRTLQDKKLVATQSGGYSYERDQVLQSKPFQARIKKLDTVKVGRHVLVTDKDAWAAIEKEATDQADKKAASKKTGKETPGGPMTAARKKELFEAKVRRLTKQRVYDVAAKACKATVTIDGPSLEFATRIRLSHTYFSAPRLGLLAALTEPVVSKEELKSWHNQIDSRKKATLEGAILQRFRSDNGFARLLTALSTVESFGSKADDPREWLDAAQLLGVRESLDSIEQKVRGEIEADRATKEAKPAKTRKNDPNGGIVGDCTVCGMKGVCTDETGIMNEHGKKKVDGKWDCKGRGHPAANLRRFHKGMTLSEKAEATLAAAAKPASKPSRAPTRVPKKARREAEARRAESEAYAGYDGTLNEKADADADDTDGEVN